MRGVRFGAGTAFGSGIHALVAQSDSRRNTLPKVLGGDALAATAPSAAAFDVVADTGDDSQSAAYAAAARNGDAFVLDLSHDQQHDHDEQRDAHASAGAVTPVPAVRPIGDCTNQQQHQDDQ
jgi:hypothetical protein